VTGERTSSLSRVRVQLGSRKERRHRPGPCLLRCCLLVSQPAWWVTPRAANAARALILGTQVHRLAGSVRVATIVLVVLALLGGLLFLRRNEKRLEDTADRALPGPLDAYT
jgi:hypothetical protein